MTRKFGSGRQPILVTSRSIISEENTSIGSFFIKKPFLCNWYKSAELKISLKAPQYLINYSLSFGCKFEPIMTHYTK